MIGRTGRLGAIAACAALLAPVAARADLKSGHPNDPLFDASPLPNATNEQWDLASPAGGYNRGISADRAWALSTGAGTTLAEIDVGVEPTHPDLAGRFTRGHDFYSYDSDPTSDTQNTHGTNVAGVLGARADNGIGIAGIAPDARLMALRTSDNILHQGVRLAEAIVYAADHGASAISMSLGADSFGSQLRRAVEYAHRRGVVMAVASGNEFHFHHHYPQLMDDVLAVGGVNPDTANTTAFNDSLALTASDFEVHASYSDYGPHLDVVAPTQVLTTQWGGGYVKNWSGTSAATPHVAAVADLVFARAKKLGMRLSPDEVIQIIRQSADDLTDPSQGYAPGWDLLSGWGRVNAYEAVKRVARGHIPPDANITAPGWYDAELGEVTVRGIVHGRSATRWTLELGQGEQPQSWARVAGGRGTATTRPVALARLGAGRLTGGGWTLRLRATDAHGNVGEDREYFRAVRDRGLVRGYPKRLGTSGEASPALADLNGDGAKDVVLATADGLMRVYSGKTGRMLPGWPRAMLPAYQSRPAARRIGTVRAGFEGTPAVGDITGDRRPEIVDTGIDGRLYAWTARGRPLPGFPYRIRLHKPDAHGLHDSAVYSSPALVDLDGDHELDVVFGAADQRIYAVKGNGRDVRGWPVLAKSTPDAAKIISSPAIGDLDGDHHPDVVEGTAESEGTTPNTFGRVYAFDRHGRSLPGWPIRPPALAANSIPLAGQGVPDSPVLADVDGDGRDEVAVSAFTGEPELYHGDGTRMSGPDGSSHFAYLGTGTGSPATAPSLLALGANSAFGRLDPGGALDYFGGGVDSRLIQAQLSPATHFDFQHLLGGWDAVSGDWLPNFPQPVEGWTIVTAPAIADVDGDGKAEVIEGTSGNVLHAFRADGSEPAGWPKRIDQWLLASPAVGDIDGDGRVEVVDVTRDGWLWAWHTKGRARGVQWGAFRHDLGNSGRYG